MHVSLTNDLIGTMSVSKREQCFEIILPCPKVKSLPSLVSTTENCVPQQTFFTPTPVNVSMGLGDGLAVVLSNPSLP